MATGRDAEDAAELEARVRRCLRDKRLAPYVERGLVEPDQVYDEVIARGVLEPAKALDSHIAYSLALGRREIVRRQINEVMQRRVVNAKTVTVAVLAAAAVALLTIGAYRSPDGNKLGYFFSTLAAALSTIVGGGLLYAAAAGWMSRKHLLTGAPFIVLGPVPLILAHQQLFEWKYQPVLGGSALLLSFAVGLGIGKPETLRQFIDIGNAADLYFNKLSEAGDWTKIRNAWLADAQENVLMPLVTHVVNDFLGEDHDKLLVEQHSEGLKRLHDLQLTIPTRSEKRVLGTMKRVDGGSIAIAGPRGAGKSTLLRVICGGRRNASPDTGLTVYASAPAEYVARDFLVELFQRVCETYITSRGHAVDRSAAQHFVLRKRALWVIRDGLWTLFRVALSLALLALLVWTLREGAKDLIEPAQKEIRGNIGELEKFATVAWGEYRWACQLLLLAMATVVLPPPRIWRHLRWHVEPALVTRAREHLLRLQVERTTTWGLNASLPGIRGATMAMTKGGSLKYLPWSYPELVGNFRAFMTEIAQEARAKRGHVVVAIDEVDRIGSVEQAERFISEIKAIFGIQNCYYIVSVAEDVGSVFARRAVIGRSVFENAFDDVVVIEPLTLTESRELLLHRVPGFTDSFAFLTHSLSGGVPRELLRVTRRLVEINLEESNAGRSYPRLDDLAAALVKEELIETLTGIRTQLPSTPEGVDLGDVFDAMRDMLRTMRLAPPCDMAPAHPRLYDFASLDTTPLSEVPELAPAHAPLVQLSAFALFCLTVIEVFDHGVFTLAQARWASTGASPASFEELAAARRELSVSPSSCRTTLTRFRAAWNLPLL